jgi:hypothetical protein
VRRFNDPPTAVTQYKALVELPFRSTFSFSGKYSGSNPCRVAAKRCLQYMKRTLKIFLILFSTLSYLQNNSDFDVFKK